VILSRLARRSLRFTPVAAASVVGSALWLYACASAPPPVQVDEPWRTRPKDVLARGADGGLPSAPRVIATLEGASIGPFLAYREESGVAAHIVQRDATRLLITTPVLRDGAPRGTATETEVPQNAMSLVIRTFGGTTASYCVMYTYPSDGGEAVGFALLDEGGRLRAPPADLGHAPGRHIGWMELVSTGQGGIAFWAEEDEGGTATLMGASISGDGGLRARATAIVRGATAWQARGVESGAALAWITSGSTDTGKSAVLYQTVDDRLRTGALPIALSGAFGAVHDIDFLRLGDRSVAAWVGRVDGRERLIVGGVDAGGRAEPARLLDAAPDGARLVGLTPGKKGVLAAWRAEREQSLGFDVGFAYLGQGSATTMVAFAKDPLEVVPMGEGFAWLSTGCAPGIPCSPEKAEPRLSEVDADLHSIRSMSLRGLLGSDLNQAWSLDCGPRACSLLGALSGTPPRVVSLRVEPKQSLAAPPPAPAKDVKQALEPVGSLGPLSTAALGEVPAALATARAESTNLVGVLSVDPPAGGGKGAQVWVAPVDATGAQLGAPLKITDRAVASGGLAMASGATTKDGAAMAWVARDDGDLQVHVARIDGKGRRVNEVQLSGVKGSASHVTLVPIAGGWLVAWVDGRGTGPEVYAARIDTELRRLTREERISELSKEGPGQPQELTAYVREGVAWLAFSDVRTRDGISAVHVARVSTHNAQRQGAVVRVSLPDHAAKYPAFLDTKDGARIVWTEEDKAVDRLVMASLDGKTGATLAPASLVAASGDAKILGLAFDPADGAHLLVLRQRGAEVSLDGLAFEGTRATLGTLGRVPGLSSLPPLLRDGALSFAVATPQGNQLGRSRVQWGRR
jgi:hypothetical protein